MDREAFKQHLKVGVIQYFNNGDIAVTFNDIDDICEFVTNEIDHAMNGFM